MLRAAIWCLLLVACVACSASPPRSKDPVVEVVEQPSSSAAAPTGPTPVVEVLYRDSWPAEGRAKPGRRPDRSLQLLGVDMLNDQFYLRWQVRKPPYFAIDTIDYAAGRRLDRWTASGRREPHPATSPFAFVPLSGSFEGDLVRTAKIMAACYAWHNSGDHSWPINTVSPDDRHIIYTRLAPPGRGGEWLVLAGADGRTIGVLDERLAASYRPLFSPRGDLIAWRACPHTPCQYGVYLSEPSVVRAGGRARRVPGFAHRTGTMEGKVQWGRHGRYLYSLGDLDGRSGRCLVRIDARSLRAHPLHCGADLQQFSLDAGYRTAVLVGEHGKPGSHWQEFTWIQLPDGAVLGKQSVDLASGNYYLTPEGLLLTRVQQGLAVIHLGDGRRADLDTRGSMPHLYYPWYVRKDRLLMLMENLEHGEVELWALDLPRLLDEQPLGETPRAKP